ncbi:MAG: PGPGW domain-containing protein [Peptococcaceae bacterium]|jgi:uncharacterized membrane protein YbaN (DUF454 family)|nr:hypothetical protein [Peptococcaceae bacterium]MDH7524686.1 PGPGW domain-containing protein [Peptococcaceae bacterium]
MDKKKLKDIVLMALGWFFLLLGVVGLFLPVLQGILFIIIGLYFLSKKSRWAKNLLFRFKSRYPAVYERLKELKRKLKR